jgi:hypothetical protein
VTNFTVSDVDGNNLAFSATSDTPPLILNSNLQISGSGANRTLSAAPKRSGTAIVTVTVSDGTTSSTLLVTVKVGTSCTETITGTIGTDVFFGTR